MPDGQPVRVVLMNDYEVVVAGLGRMLQPFADRVDVVQHATDGDPVVDADIVLYDAFAAASAPDTEIDAVLSRCDRQRLVVFSWNCAPEVVETSLSRGISGYLSKQLDALELVAALEAIRAGEQVVSPPPTRGAQPRTTSRTWPGREHGLTEREAEVIALILQGLSNEQIADRAFLSINTVKSYIQSAYRKMRVSSRSQAILWAIDRGFRAQHAWRSAARSDEL